MEGGDPVFHCRNLWFGHWRRRALIIVAHGSLRQTSVLCPWRLTVTSVTLLLDRCLQCVTKIRRQLHTAASSPRINATQSRPGYTSCNARNVTQRQLCIVNLWIQPAQCMAQCGFCMLRLIAMMLRGPPILPYSALQIDHTHYSGYILLVK